MPCKCGLTYQFTGVLGGLFRPDFPAHNKPAEQVRNEIQVKERPLDSPRKIRDIPHPHLIGRSSRMRGNFAVSWHNGKKLLDYSLQKATELGYGAVLFEGNIEFYGKSGLDYARNFGIRYHDLPEDADSSFFLCKELKPGYLSDVTGVYQTPQAYYVKDEDVEEFDKDFPEKVKLRLPGQIF